MKANNRSVNKKILYALLVMLTSLLSCTPKDELDVLFTGDSYTNLMQYVEANPDFSSFNKIVNAGKMKDALSAYNSNGGIDYTLFLPTNDAVTKFIDGNENYSTLDDLLKDAAYCTEIVRYHLVNGRIFSNEFPNGALANKTISNYYLTIYYKEENNAITYSVNGESKVVNRDIDLANGTIHTIDKMLTPVVFTSYQWLQKASEFSIFSELLSKCGLADTLNAYEVDELGRQTYNEHTIFAESNSLYAKNNITSFEQLALSINPAANMLENFTNPANLVNKYARYHILEKSVFLDELISGVYNTYGDFPVAVDLNDIIKLNTGTKVFNTIINNGDTTVINYLQVDLNKSNIVTRSGAIHQLDHLLFPFLPGRQSVTFQFYEEPVINALRTVQGDHLIVDEDLDFINLTGTKSLNYYKSATAITGNTNADYIKIAGNFEFSFTTTKILAGRYRLKFVMDRGISTYASVQTYVDGQKVGVVLDLSKDTPGFQTFTIGNVESFDFRTQTVKISTVIPGTILIDRIIFEPI
jgi:uncharacterized surface protein with fasciclin (FAS1) repeats